MRKHAWLLTNLALLLVTAGAGFFVITYRQDIQDWWALRQYEAPADIKQIADETTMIGRGRDLFYVSQPQVEASQDFNMHCSRTGEKTVVLGCYTAQRIYLYDVTDARLYGVKQVTAAHEMLHAAYERMNDGDKAKLDTMLEAELTRVTDARLKELIALYAKTEPGEKLNEMHSILGTEYGNLSPDLEKYYKQYFTDRSKVVDFANQYRGTFEASQAKIAQLEAQIEALKKQIDTNTGLLNQQKAEIDADVARLNTLRATDVNEYNKAVPGYNAKASAYNKLVLATRGIIDHYNALVVEHNSEAAAQNSLYNSLDSHYQTVN
ncbi:MAG TPA: hypothetical protein VM581_04215 [Magnetospirillaceae bacterium]|nr:hypothetical protein [Magnetospirillaceae bacterium]